jgi:hypothetical protein
LSEKFGKGKKPTAPQGSLLDSVRLSVRLKKGIYMYNVKFSLDKNFAKPSYMYLWWNKFHQRI